MKPFISTKFYGVFMFIVSIALIASPWLFNLVNVSSAALFLPIYIGWLQLIMTIFVDTPVGFIRRFPLQTHLVLNVFMGFVLMVSPWLYTFSSKNSGTAFWSPLLLGALLFCLGVFTDKSPFLSGPHRAAREGLLTSIDSI